MTLEILKALVNVNSLELGYSWSAFSGIIWEILKKKKSRCDNELIPIIYNKYHVR